MDDLVRLDRLAPALIAATGDERWGKTTVTLIAGGKSNLTYELRSPAGALILRRPPSGALLPSAHDMGREAWIQKSLQGTSVPVPRVVLEADAEILGVPFYVMERVDGHIIRTELPPNYLDSLESPGELSFALVDVLADLHSVNPKSVGLEAFGRPEGFIERQIRRFRSQWQHTKTRDVPVVDELARQLTNGVPKQQDTSIVHGDYRLDNCIMDLDDPGRMRAVLDWEMSTLGDPLSDLGLLLFYWREQGEPEPILTPTITHLEGFPTRREIAERYVSRTGASLEHIGFYEALAHFKFAVIAQGIAARVNAGAMAGQDFGDLDDEILRISNAGLTRLAQKE